MLKFRSEAPPRAWVVGFDGKTFAKFYVSEAEWIRVRGAYDAVCVVSAEAVATEIVAHLGKPDVEAAIADSPEVRAASDALKTAHILGAIRVLNLTWTDAR